VFPNFTGKQHEIRKEFQKTVAEMNRDWPVDKNIRATLAFGRA
jgi:hypothetical protein